MPPFSAAGRWQAEVAETLRNRPPRIIIMGVLEGTPHEYQYPPATSRSPVAALFNETLASRYQRVKTIKEYEIFERIR